MMRNISLKKKTYDGNKRTHLARQEREKQKWKRERVRVAEGTWVTW